MKVKIFHGESRRVENEFNSFFKNSTVSIIDVTTSPVSNWNGYLTITVVYK